MIIPSGDASDAERQTHEPRSGEVAQPLDNILHYISSGWDSLTRSMDDCKTLEDVKVVGEPILYFPANLPIPPAIQELQSRCAVRIEHLPAKIDELGQIILTQTSPRDCSTWNTPTWCRAANSTKCTGGTATSLFAAC